MFAASRRRIIAPGRNSSIWTGIPQSKSSRTQPFQTCVSSCQRQKTKCMRDRQKTLCPVNGQDEMEEVFVQMDSFCTGSGRAGELGCNVQRLIRRPGKEESLEVLR